MVLITELFASQQFEGKNCGESTVFVRFKNCDMKPLCRWCDVQGYKAKSMRIREVVSKIKKFKKLRHVTFSGGSPNIYKKEIAKIMQLLPDYEFSLELNGLVMFSPKLFKSIAISPKKQKINVGNLIRYKQFDNVFFKFVVENKQSYENWKKLIDNLEILHNKVYMMPLGTNPRVIKERSRILSKCCIDDGFNMSTRVQILLFGKKKGV